MISSLLPRIDLCDFVGRIPTSIRSPPGAGGGVAAPAGPGGAPSTIGRTHKIKGRILCLFGEKDGYIPSDQVEAIKAALKDAGVNHETVVYPGADHGFFCDQRESHQQAAATDAWDRVKALFAAELQGGA